MSIDCHIRGSGGRHEGRKEYAKANGIWRQLSDEEYEREKAKIEVHLEVMMELLQKEEEDQRCGFLVKIKLKWHKLQRIREQLMNAQCEEGILKERECLREVLKTEASSETKRSQCFETVILYMSTGTMNKKMQFSNVVIKNEGGGQNFNFVQRNDETIVSHANTLTHREEGDAF